MKSNEINAEKEKLERKYNMPVFDPLEEFEKITDVIVDL